MSVDVDDRVLSRAIEVLYRAVSIYRTPGENVRMVLEELDRVGITFARKSVAPEARVDSGPMARAEAIAGGLG